MTDAFVSIEAGADDIAAEHTPTAAGRSRKRLLAAGATVLVTTVLSAAPAWASPVMGC
jgi:hypothetical protein